MKLYSILILSTIFFQIQVHGQKKIERPIILVKSGDRISILDKIEKDLWAKNTYINFIEKLNLDVDLHQANSDKFLRGMPFNWDKAKTNETPPFHLTYHLENGIRENLDNATTEEWKNGKELIRYLQIAVDAGIAYYLTNDDKYAQCAIDILNAFVNGVMQLEVSSWHGRGGWLFPDDGFREVREIGYKVPLIYDFIASFINNGGKPYDIIRNIKIDFQHEKTQEVFRTYADITINYGHTGSNHPVLEATSLVFNALAMENAAEREKLLSYFLTENTENQDALDVMARNYKKEGDIWPETSQYLNAVSTILTRLMLIVNKYDPSLHLGNKYSNVLFSLPILDYLVYPNGEIIRWGDGHRNGNPTYSSYEDAYLLGLMDGNEKIINSFGPLLRRAMEEGKYKRRGIEAVLRHGVEIPDSTRLFELPRTDKLDHAGIFLQRNLSSTHKPEDGLMCFVGGAHMVHGHAEGMNIELYGKGQVLGVDNGRGKYQKDIHENYSRIYAAHNTVIVNGSSQGEGGWSNLGINTVQLISMEPMPLQTALSPYHSFSQTSFLDDKGDMAEATQERTLALVRTSPTTGYYVDVFRSKSGLPNQYHDYLYHNIGDKLMFLNQDLVFKSDENRYKANANGEWIRNKAFRNPGWHFFKDIKTAWLYNKDVEAVFSIKKLKGNPIFMGLHIPGFNNREYTTLIAPHTFEAPTPYDDLPTPTLVIRKKGEAWEAPFVVVYEPFDKNIGNASIISLEKLEQEGIYKGLIIRSKTPTQDIVQYVITQSKNQIFENKKLDIYFKGTYAVITLNEKEKLQNIYVGEGEKLVFKKKEFIPENPNKSLYIDYVKQNSK